MLFDVWMQNLIIPFGQSLLYDLSKVIFSQITTPFYLKKSLNSAITKGVNSVLQARNKNMANGISKTIQISCENKIKPDIYGIVKREFEQWGEENLNCQIVSSQISTNILQNICACPELCDALTFPMLIELSNNFNALSNNIQTSEKNTQKTFSKFESTHQTTIGLISELHECVHEIKNKMNEISQTVLNSKYIPNEYKNFFLRPLFFEHNIRDGAVATLKDVYIENDFYILDFPFHNKDKKYSGLINFIKDFINSNLLQSNYHTPFSFEPKHIRVLFIKGQPGSGKSSLFYYLAYIKSQLEHFFPNYKFYFIKLIEIYDATNGELNVKNPLEDIEKIIQVNSPFENKCVLVLDGLDEICVARNLDINEYVNNLIRIAARKSNLKIIITTRLNYINIRNSDNKNVINIQLNPLSPKDLDKWVDKYFGIHDTLLNEKDIAKRNIKYLKTHAKDNMMEVFAIPLLFYMIVTSKIDISKISSIGELYDNVFSELRERNYNEFDIDFFQKHGVNERIPNDLARQIAIEISYEMYKNNKLLLKIHSQELDDALEKAQYSNYNVSNSDKSEMERLFPITFFYKDSVDVVEFAHKSIMEFFVAEKLFQQLEVYNGNLRGFIEHFIVNPVVITTEVLNFLTYFFNNKSNSKEIRAKYIDVLEDFKIDILEKNHYLNKNVNYVFETPKIIYKIYWYFIREITRCSPTTISEFINEDVVKRYILGILSIKDSSTIPFLDDSVFVIDYSYLEFNHYNFSFCNLEHKNFSNSTFKNCSFSFSNLTGSKFKNLKVLGNLSFESCNFKDTEISITKMKRNGGAKQSLFTADFIGCNFDNSIFKNTDISNMNFESISSMTGAQFIEVKMNLKQLLNFSCFSVWFDKVDVYLRLSDFNEEENKKILKCERDKKEEYIIKLAKTKAHNYVVPELMQNVSFIVDYPF